MYSEIVRKPQFYLDENGSFYPEATVFILTGEKLLHLYHMLNSQITVFLFKRFYAGGGLGELGYRYKKLFLENLPIPRINLPLDSYFNEAIFSLYRLNSQEVAFIESQLTL